MDEYQQSILRLEAKQRELEEAQQKALAAKQSYEQAVQEIQQNLPRVTPEIIAAYRKYIEAEKAYGELDWESHPNAKKLIAHLGKLIDPGGWEWWTEDSDEG